MPNKAASECKDVNNVKDCLKLLSERGESIPRFVSHFLDKIPSVGFGNMDASALLSRMERLSQEVSMLRGVMETQANVSENLGLATATLERRLTDIETPHESIWANEAAPGPKQRETPAPRLPGEDAKQQPLSPVWSRPPVLKEGKPKPQKALKMAVLLRPGFQNRSKREQCKGGIIGTGTASNITVVKTKLVSVFASRFSPDLDADTLCAYFTEKLGKSVTCRKIDSTHNRFSSFHITAECNEVADPQLWLSGVYVRRCFRLKINSVRSACGSETGTQREYSENVFAPEAPQGSNGHADRDELMSVI
ncbi:hypothetical protein ABVT39_023677 [Epinephelus coioides]